MSHCPDCYLSARGCICAEVPLVASGIAWLVVRHMAERRRPGNTGRLVARALGCPMVDHGLPGVAPRLPVRAGAWLLFPDRPGARPPGQPSQIVVVDGTWQQARRMVQRLPALAGLPRLGLPGLSAAAPRLRRSPRPDGMSTLQAVAETVALLEGEALAAPLRVLHDEVVRRLRPA